LQVHVSLPGSAEYASILIGADGSETFSSSDVEHVVTVRLTVDSFD
jgi:hypothetical protein